MRLDALTAAGFTHDIGVTKVGAGMTGVDGDRMKSIGTVGVLDGVHAHPKGRRMPKRAIYQRKGDGKWAVIELPDAYKDGDRLPLRRSTDQWFDSRDEERTELLKQATED